MNARFIMISVVLLVGCEARTEVLQEKITARIDQVLGEFDVKQKQVEIAIRKMESDIDQVAKAKIETNVRLTQLNSKIQVADAKQAEVDKTILRLRDYLAKGGAVEISGKTFTEQQVKEMAEKAIGVRKKLVSELEVLKKSTKQIESIIETLGQREYDAMKSLDRMKLAHQELKTKTIALNAMHDTAEIANSGGALDFDSLEQQINDISGKIDVEIAFHEQKNKSNSNSSADFEEITRLTSTLSDTISEIDSLGITEKK